jgi:hypothetical protein
MGRVCDSVLRELGLKNGFQVLATPRPFRRIGSCRDRVTDSTTHSNFQALRLAQLPFF